MNIILLGYMASGKSKIGLELAKTLSFNFKDLDDVIQLEEKKSIKEIFNDSGELYFREKEKEYLHKVLESCNNTIISLGGGTPCYYNTMDELVKNPNVKTLYLNVSIPVLVTRLKNEKLKRPIISHIETDALLTEFISKHLFERSLYYNQAEYKVNANGSVNNVVENIVLQLF